MRTMAGYDTHGYKGYDGVIRYDEDAYWLDMAMNWLQREDNMRCIL